MHVLASHTLIVHELGSDTISTTVNSTVLILTMQFIVSKTLVTVRGGSRVTGEYVTGTLLDGRGSVYKNTGVGVDVGDGVAVESLFTSFT